MLLHWKCRPYGRFSGFPARTDRDADQSAVVGEFACRLTRRVVEVVKVEVRAYLRLTWSGEEWGRRKSLACVTIMVVPGAGFVRKWKWEERFD